VDSAGRNTRILLVLLVVVGAALRFYGLDLQSLWVDELATWRLCNRDTLGAVIDAVRADRAPPGYQILVFQVIRYVGDSEVALRLPSAVAGLLAIPMIHLLGARLYSRREGIVASVLMAFSITPIHYSQEARVYSLLVLLVIVSFYFWVALMRALEAGDRPSWGVQLGYVASAVATEYLHHFGLLIVALQGVGLVSLFAVRPRALARVAALGALVVLAYVPWLPELARMGGRTDPFWVEDPSFDSIRKTWRFFFRRPGALKRLAAILCGVYLARALWDAWRGPRPTARSIVTSPSCVVLLWLVLPFLFAFTWSKLSIPILHWRYLIVSLPAAYLLLARALVHTVPHAKARAALVAALAVMLLYGLIGSGRYYAEGRKEQFREAAALVAEHDAEYPGARILAHGGYEYYLRRFRALDRLEPVSGRGDEVERVGVLLGRERPEYVWLLSGHRRADEAFLESLEPGYQLLRYDRFFGAWVRLYQRR